MKRTRWILTGLLLAALVMPILLAQPAQKNTYYNKWSNAGPLKNADFFPIAVWYQPVGRAGDYAAAGVNLYVGPSVNSSSALNTMKNNGMYTMTGYSNSLKNDANASRILGWTHQDEPDNDQGGNGCVNPTEIQTKYTSWTSQDPTRPIYLNLGKGVADIFAGLRGTCSGQWEMYIDYLKGCDIPSYDIYPVTDDAVAVTGNCWYVAKGIDSLRSWSNYEKPCWCWIECTHINSPSLMPTPVQTRSEVWQALIHEAGGFGYFCHEWYPSFSETAWLSRYPSMKATITQTNNEIKQLARALNSPTIQDQVTVTVNWRTPVETMLKNEGGYSYLFCVSNRRGATTNTATIAIDGLPASVTSGEVIGESRNVTVANGQFQDAFSEWEVHLYKFSSSVNITDNRLKLQRKMERAIRLSSPVADRLVITKDNDLKGQDLTIRICDASGQVRAKGFSSGSSPAVAMDCSFLEQGTYYVVFGAGAAGTVKRFVIIK